MYSLQQKRKWRRISADRSATLRIYSKSVSLSVPEIRRLRICLRSETLWIRRQIRNSADLPQIRNSADPQIDPQLCGSTANLYLYLCRRSADCGSDADPKLWIRRQIRNSADLQQICISVCAGSADCGSASDPKLCGSADRSATLRIRSKSVSLAVCARSADCGSAGDPPFCGYFPRMWCVLFCSSSVAKYHHR